VTNTDLVKTIETIMLMDASKPENGLMKLSATNTLLELSFNDEVIEHVFTKHDATIPVHLENLFQVVLKYHD
jgi:hypothetical protein